MVSFWWVVLAALVGFAGGILLALHIFGGIVAPPRW